MGTPFFTTLTANQTAQAMPAHILDDSVSIILGNSTGNYAAGNVFVGIGPLNANITGNTSTANCGIPIIAGRNVFDPICFNLLANGTRNLNSMYYLADAGNVTFSVSGSEII